MQGIGIIFEKRAFVIGRYDGAPMVISPFLAVVYFNIRNQGLSVFPGKGHGKVVYTLRRYNAAPASVTLLNKMLMPFQDKRIERLRSHKPGNGGKVVEFDEAVQG